MRLTVTPSRAKDEPAESACMSHLAAESRHRVADHAVVFKVLRRTGLSLHNKAIECGPPSNITRDLLILQGIAIPSLLILQGR